MMMMMTQVRVDICVPFLVFGKTTDVCNAISQGSGLVDRSCNAVCAVDTVSRLHNGYSRYRVSIRGKGKKKTKRKTPLFK